MDREPDAETANAIQMTTMCLKFKQLPRAGGVLEQDSYAMWMMQIVLQVLEEKREMEEKRQKAKQRPGATPRRPPRRR